MIIFFTSCSLISDESTTCTEEFRIIGLKIYGATLTDFYTVGIVRSDTIRLNKSGVSPEWYPVLDDSYQKTLAGKEERFIFYGFVEDSLMVEEHYIINADHCHISKVQGQEEKHLSR